MANLIVFEDSFRTIGEITDCIEGTGHNLADFSMNIKSAHTTLGRIAAGNIDADYILVDGNLGTGYDEQPTFRFTPPGKELPPLPPASPAPTKTILKKLWDIAKPETPTLPKQPRINPHEIVVPPVDQSSFYSDGIQICKIVRALNDRLGLKLVTIGISSSPAEDWGSLVDYDLTKSRISRLIDLIGEIETQTE